MTFLGGQLLIASPHLSDRNFFRSVVLIVSHNDEHAFGLLLNRPIHEPLGKIWSELTDEECSNQVQIRSGGPLQGPLMVIHQNRKAADTQIAPSVQLSSTRNSIRQLLENNNRPLIPIVGYSGWGPGQLESEMEIGGWMTVPGTKEIIFANPDDQWNIASRQVSDSILAGVELRHVPNDPRWN